MRMCISALRWIQKLKGVTGADLSITVFQGYATTAYLEFIIATIRSSQRLFSVKYLFGDANIA